MSNLPLLVLVALLALWFVYSRGFKIGADDAKKMVEKGARLIDVRTPSEFASGHIAGAINVPLSDLARRRDALGEKDSPLVVYCASGMRSASARRTLKRFGFSNVHDLGAMNRW